MPSEPSVGVCIPTYQGAAFLESTLASIAAQERPADEVLVVDDGSTDATLDIVDGFADRIDGLRVVRNAARLGIAGNPNRCLELATAEWVVVMGQDDLLDPDHLARKVPWTVGGTGMVVSGRRYDLLGPLAEVTSYDDVAEQYLGQDLGDATLSAADFARVMAGRLSVNAIGEPVAVLLRRQLALDVGGFDVTFRQLWDLDLWLRLGVRATSTFLRDPMATFRVHVGSASFSHIPDYSVMHLELLRLRAKIAHDPAYDSLRPALRKRPGEPAWVESARLAYHARLATRRQAAGRPAARQAWRAAVHDLFRGRLRPLRRPAVLGVIAQGGRAVRCLGGSAS